MGFTYTASYIRFAIYFTRDHTVLNNTFIIISIAIA